MKCVDPDGRFQTKAFVFATLQTLGGVVEVVGGCITTGVSAGVTKYVVIDGIYNIADGVTSMVAAATDTDWDGFIPEMASAIAEKTGASEQTQELVGAYASLADTVIDGIATKGISLTGDGSKAVSSATRIISGLNDIGSNLGEGDAILNASKETMESIKEYKDKQEIKTKANYYYNLYGPKETLQE